MTTKLCIACAEQIQEAALLCKHCGTRQDDKSFNTAQATVQEPEVIQGNDPEQAPYWIESTSTHTVCNYCGKLNIKGFNICSGCGGLLDDKNGRFLVNPNKSVSIPKAVEKPKLAPTPGIAIAGIICAFFIPILGLILGYAARSEVRNPNNPSQGEGLATGAIVIGWIWICALVLWLFIVLAAAGQAASTYN